MDPSAHTGIGVEIKRLNNMIGHCFEREFAEHYFAPTLMQGRIIAYLYENRDRDLFQRDIEREFSIRSSTATSTLKLMEKHGLVRRRDVPYDGRLKKLELTPKAMAFHKEFIRERNRIEARLLEGLSEEEILQFRSTLAKISANTR